MNSFNTTGILKLDRSVGRVSHNVLCLFIAQKHLYMTLNAMQLEKEMWCNGCYLLQGRLENTSFEPPVGKLVSYNDLALMS